MCSILSQGSCLWAFLSQMKNVIKTPNYGKGWLKNRYLSEWTLSCSNKALLFLFCRYTKMKTATNIYIFNLAMADALVTTTMPFQSTEYLMNSWPFGDVLCKIVISIDYYNMFTSIFTLTMMSVDRYIAVCHPVKALDFRTPLKAKIINICIWLLSSSVGISAIVLGGTKVREGECEHSKSSLFISQLVINCRFKYWQNLIYSFFKSTSKFLTFWNILWNITVQHTNYLSSDFCAK